MAKRKRTGRPAPPAAHQPPRELDGIAELLNQGDLNGARDQLLALAERPNPHPLVLDTLARVAEQLKDSRTYLYALEVWHRQDPNNADVTLALGGTYLMNVRPVLALQTFESFLDRWPDHPEATQLRSTVEELRPAVAEIIGELGLVGEEGLQIATLHEQVQSLMDQGKTGEARAAAQKLLKLRPDFIPGLNNLALVNIVDGLYDQAVSTARRVLELDPDNVHARANLVRALTVSGQIEAARAEADRLLEPRDIEVDEWLRLAEAFTFVGDDERVLEVYERAKSSSALDQADGALLYHLAAVAAMNTGDQRRARRLWERAVKQEPGLNAAQENLADLLRPVGQRHAPWPFEFRNWVSNRIMSALFSEFTAATIAGDEDKFARAVRRMLRHSPELKAIVPVLLERGDSAGRTLALQIATFSQDPALLDALRDFALSQRGPDSLRNQALTALQEAGRLPPGETVRMWIEGEWTPIQVLGFELHDDPTGVWHTPEVEEVLVEALEALQRGDAPRAESLLRQALEVEPYSPDIRHNLALACGMQGRLDETEALLRALQADEPDYVFATLGLAQVMLKRKRTAEARELLEPLLTRSRFHVDEYVGLGSLMIELSRAEGNRDAARTWQATLKSVVPDHPLVQGMPESG